jgi:putative MATE family efflux protein
MSLNRQIFNIAIPSIVGFLGLILFESADVYWVGKLGSKAVAAMGAAFFLEWLLYALMNLSITGCGTLVAQFIGAKSEERFHVIRESFWLSLIISGIIMAFLFFFAPLLFRFMGLDQETLTLAMEYFLIFTIGFPVLYLYTLQGHIFNAYGDTRTKTYIMLGILLLNIVLDPFLIFGWLFFPELGMRGAAMATVFSEIIGLFINTIILRKNDYIAPLYSFLKFSTRHIKHILRIGIPAATTNAVWTIVFPILTSIITRFGMEPLAGLNIANRLEGFPYFFAVGFSIAIATLVGQSYGKGDKEQVWQIVKRGTILITIILVPVSLVFILVPEFLVGILSNDPLVIMEGARYLRIVGYFELFLGWQLVIEGAFNGLGNTRPYMLISVPLTLVRIPLAYWMAISLNMGITGVWWAISITTLLKGIILVILFVTNRRNRELLAVSKTA